MLNTLAGKIVASEEVLSREIKDETVLLDLKSESYFSLGGVGSRIWQLIGEGATLHDMSATLASEYQVGEDVLTQDLSRFVGDLVEAGLVSIESPEAKGR